MTSDEAAADSIKYISHLASYLFGTTRLWFQYDRLRQEGAIACLQFLSLDVHWLNLKLRRAHPEIHWARLDDLAEYYRRHRRVEPEIVWDDALHALGPLRVLLLATSS